MRVCFWSGTVNELVRRGRFAFVNIRAEPLRGALEAPLKGSPAHLFARHTNSAEGRGQNAATALIGIGCALVMNQPAPCMPRTEARRTAGAGDGL